MPVKDLIIRLKTRGAKTTQKDIAGIERTISTMGKSIAGITIAAGTFAKAIDWAKQAGKVQDLSRAHESLAKSQKLSANVMLDEMRTATRGTVREMDLLQQANNAMLLELPVTERTMAELAGAGRRLGKAMGIDAKQGLESLVVGIGRQSKLWLDNLGIIIDTNRSYAEHAKALGKTASALTDTEKKTAFFNATLESVRKKMKALGKDQDSFTDSVQRLGVAYENLTTILGMKVAPSLANLFEGITGWLDGSAKKAWDEFVKGATIEEWVAAVTLAVDPTNKWATALISTSDSLREAKKSGDDLLSGTSGFNLLDFAKKSKELSEGVTGADSPIETQISALDRLQERANEVVNKMRESQKHAEILFEALGGDEIRTDSIKEIADTTQWWNEELIIARGYYKEISDEAIALDSNMTSVSGSQRMWAQWANQTHQSLASAAGVLAGIMDMSRGGFSFSGLLRVGSGIASLIPGGQGVAAALLGGSQVAAAGGFKEGGTFTASGPDTGYDVAMRLHGKEEVKISPEKETRGDTIINLNGIFYQDIDQLADAIAERSDRGHNRIRIKDRV